MIPLSMRESISYKDEDGLDWTFKPKTGEIERILLGMRAGAEPEAVVAETDRVFGLIFVSVIDPAGKYKTVKTEDGLKLFSTTEKMEILRMWSEKANAIPAEDKKK